MSIVVKAGAGLAAGVVAGALGLAFLPRLEPSAVQPRNAVEKPQFVVASAGVAAAPQPAATLAVATETPIAKPAPTAAPAPLALASTPSPSALPAPSPSAVVALAPVDSPTAPLASPAIVAKVEAPAQAVPTPGATVAAPGNAPPASPDAARWSVRGLIALARGDIFSARLFLARAAEAGDARAWVALADTYDPAMLAKFGVVFAPGDALRAKEFLVKAVAAGVFVPKDRLAAIDQGERQVR